MTHILADLHIQFEFIFLTYNYQNSFSCDKALFLKFFRRKFCQLLFCHVKARFHVEVSTQFSIGTPKFYVLPYGKINYRLVNLSYICDRKSGLRAINSFKTFSFKKNYLDLIRRWKRPLRGMVVIFAYLLFHPIALRKAKIL